MTPINNCTHIYPLHANGYLERNFLRLPSEILDNIFSLLGTLREQGKLRAVSRVFHKIGFSSLKRQHILAFKCFVDSIHFRFPVFNVNQLKQIFERVMHSQNEISEFESLNREFKEIVLKQFNFTPVRENIAKLPIGFEYIFDYNIIHIKLTAILKNEYVEIRDLQIKILFNDYYYKLVVQCKEVLLYGLIQLIESESVRCELLGGISVSAARRNEFKTAIHFMREITDTSKIFTPLVTIAEQYFLVGQMENSLIYLDEIHRRAQFKKPKFYNEILSTISAYLTKTDLKLAFNIALRIDDIPLKNTSVNYVLLVLGKCDFSEAVRLIRGIDDPHEEYVLIFSQLYFDKIRNRLRNEITPRINETLSQVCLNIVKKDIDLALLMAYNISQESLRNDTLCRLMNSESYLKDFEVMSSQMRKEKMNENQISRLIIKSYKKSHDLVQAMKLVEDLEFQKINTIHEILNQLIHKVGMDKAHVYSFGMPEITNSLRHAWVNILLESDNFSLALDLILQMKEYENTEGLFCKVVNLIYFKKSLWEAYETSKYFPDYQIKALTQIYENLELRGRNAEASKVQEYIFLLEKSHP